MTKPCKHCKVAAVCLSVGYKEMVERWANKRIKEAFDPVYEEFARAADRIVELDKLTQKAIQDMNKLVAKDCPEAKKSCLDVQDVIVDRSIGIKLEEIPE